MCTLNTWQKVTMADGQQPLLPPVVKLGSQGMEVSQQGLGCMGLTAYYGNPTPQEEGIKVIHHAVNSGVTFFDTSEVYGPHTNEIFLGKVFLITVQLQPWIEKYTSKRDGSNVALSSVEYGVALSSSWSNCPSKFKTGITRIRETLKNYVSFRSIKLFNCY